jgi:hypothetical protein
MFILESCTPSDNCGSKVQTIKFTPEVKDLKAPIECSVKLPSTCSRTSAPLTMQQLGKSDGTLAMVGPSKDKQAEWMREEYASASTTTHFMGHVMNLRTTYFMRRME